MLTLSYGFKKPQTGDRGNVWFPGLEDDIQQINDHTHNGINSAFIPGSSLTKFTSSIVAAGWVSDGGGNYHQLVTVPGGISGAATYNDIIYYAVVCKRANAGADYGDEVLLGVERESATTFTVRTNDNTMDILITYL